VNGAIRGVGYGPCLSLLVRLERHDLAKGGVKAFFALVAAEFAGGASEAVDLTRGRFSWRFIGHDTQLYSLH